MAGEVARHLAADRWDAAREAAAWYANVFDGRYYLEVQAHDTPGQRELNGKVLRLADELGLPVVATNDAHFLRPATTTPMTCCSASAWARTAATRTACATMRGSTSSRPTRSGSASPTGRTSSRTRWPLPTAWMSARAGSTTCRSSRCRRTSAVGGRAAAALAFEKARARFGDPLPAGWDERLEYELGVISNEKADYAGYFLITQDFINWAKEHGIPVGPGRGSAAGSLVAYVLGITDVDPLQFDLLFERFLNPDRVSMPDIDIDFCYERRGEVIEYVREKYGKDSVGQIITFGTMKSRAVVRDVGRVLGFEPAETDRLAKLIPNAPNNSLTVAEAAERVARAEGAHRGEPRVAQLVEYAKVLEGLSRHASVHAAGVVIAPGRCTSTCPSARSPRAAAAAAATTRRSSSRSGT
jgi:DNA polymerase III subunit alpha